MKRLFFEIEGRKLESYLYKYLIDSDFSRLIFNKSSLIATDYFVYKVFHSYAEENAFSLKCYVYLVRSYLQSLKSTSI
jgi:hypothetical protein